MSGLICRNLKMYFNDRSGVFFSLMGAMISFILYLAFLSQNMITSWARVPDTKLLLDPWLIGGTLTITAITTTLSSLSLMVQDRENNVLEDIDLTDISYVGIQFAYIVTSMFVGVIMQLIMYLIMGTFFMIVDNSMFNLMIFPQMFGLSVLSSFTWTIFNLLLLSFVKKVDTLGKIGTIIGTASGFFAGVYIPIGTLPTTMQNLMKVTPAPYNSAMYRDVLMNVQLNKSFSKLPTVELSKFKKVMGISVDWNRALTFQQDMLIFISFAALISLCVFLISRISRRLILSKV
ncbi:ABC transporter permease [Companilactobacillus jidongensis]|uniref:ABC transporter permease n=1 Tax=Companilactobacillus jidongensis TaxID=2486006 RepID=UPI000F7B3A08|nr:ABC transporter permease [Companilactobacillus jidongensis]